MSRRLERVYQKADRIGINYNTKIVCMSDCHRGIGNHGDNFLPNQNLFFAALKYYYDKGFCYIELGDGDELWENKDLSKVIEIYNEVFYLLSKFYCEGRLRMLYGNHDCIKKKENYMNCHSREYFCENRHCKCDLFPNIKAEEGILLQDIRKGHEIFLIHGHQGDFLNDTLWPLARFLVRNVWRPLELLGVSDPTSAAKNYKKRKKTEQRLEKFAKEKQMLLIAGHTHRPVLPPYGDSFYLNDGSCVHPRCITAIEIEKGCLTLVKWSVMARCNRNLSVERKVLQGPNLWEKYFGYGLGL